MFYCLNVSAFVVLVVTVVVAVYTNRSNIVVKCSIQDSLLVY